MKTEEGFQSRCEKFKPWRDETGAPRRRSTLNLLYVLPCFISYPLCTSVLIIIKLEYWLKQVNRKQSRRLCSSVSQNPVCTKTFSIEVVVGNDATHRISFGWKLYHPHVVNSFLFYYYPAGCWQPGIQLQILPWYYFLYTCISRQ